MITGRISKFINGYRRAMIVEDGKFITIIKSVRKQHETREAAIEYMVNHGKVENVKPEPTKEQKAKQSKVNETLKRAGVKQDDGQGSGSKEGSGGSKSTDSSTSSAPSDSEKQGSPAGRDDSAEGGKGSKSKGKQGNKGRKSKEV